jgi:hypothetical protein
VSSNKVVIPNYEAVGCELSLLPTEQYLLRMRCGSHLYACCLPISTTHALWKPSVRSVTFRHIEKTGNPYFSNDEVLHRKQPV